MSHVPLIPEIGIITLPTDPWHSPFSQAGAPSMARSSHQLMGRLCSIYPVVWLEPPFERDAILKAARRWTSTMVNSPDIPGLRAMPTPPWLPELHRPEWLRDLLRSRRLGRAKNALARKGARQIVLSLWRPAFRYALDHLPDAFSVYHVCDEYSFADEPGRTPADEEVLIRRADRVFVHSPGLMDTKGRMNPNTCLTPNGVDYASYARSWPEPAALAAIPRPRLGYTGALKKHLDWELLRRVARDNPQWSLVLLGAPEPHPEIADVMREIHEFPNVWFLPPVSASEVPAYVANFDVCMLPYRLMGYTENIYPLKLHESLAAGKPVIATPIRTVRDFADVVTLAGKADQWSEFLREVAAAPPDLDAVEARRAVAVRFDWSRPVFTIAREIASALAPERLTVLDRLNDAQRLLVPSHATGA